MLAGELINKLRLMPADAEVFAADAGDPSVGIPQATYAVGEAHLVPDMSGEAPVVVVLELVI